MNMKRKTWISAVAGVVGLALALAWAFSPRPVEVELAPVTGLADLIVDLVETGSTLRENGLEERETVCSISSLLVANRTLFKLHHERIAPLVEGLRLALDGARRS